MKSQAQHGHIPIMHLGYEFECTCLAKESSLHNLYFMCRASRTNELNR